MIIQAQRGVSEWAGTLGLSLVLGACPCFADELKLKNGDRVSGKVVGFGDNKLVFKTEAFGEVKVAVEAIASITTDEIVAVEFKDGGHATGSLSPLGNNTTRLTRPDRTTLPLHLAEISEIYPDGKIPPPTFKWTGHIDAGVGKHTGNTRLEDYDIDAEAIGRRDKHRITSDGHYHWEKANGQETIDNSKFRIEYDRFLSKEIYLYLSGGAEHDQFADLRLRTTIGPGLGYQIVDTARTQLSFEGGPAYVTENYYTAPDKDFPSARWQITYRMWVFGRFAQLFLNNEGHVDEIDPADVLMHTKAGVRLPFRDGLQLALKVRWTYDTEPAPGTKSSDQKYIMSVGYHW
jgi:putative salt-induced outer membrane protein YdiY